MKITISLIVIIMLLTLTGCSNGYGAGENEETGSQIPVLVEEARGEETSAPEEVVAPEKSNEAAQTIGDDTPISRALAVRMAVLALSDGHTIAGLEREIAYVDSAPNDWFDRYINAAYVLGIIIGDGEGFRPLDDLTVQEAQAILNRLNPDNPVRMRLTDDNRNMPVSYALWVSLYESTLRELEEAGANTGIRERSIIVLAAPSNNSQLPEGNIIADSGAFSGAGIDFSNLIDKQIRILEKDGEILATMHIESQTPTIIGAYIVNMGGGSLTIFLGGAERTFAYRGSGQDRSGSVATFVLSDNEVTELVVHEESFRDRVLLHDWARIEFAGRGEIPLNSHFRVYSEERERVSWRSARNIIVGSETSRFYEYNGTIIAAVIEERPPLETIRVVIMDSDFRGFTHETVDISSSARFEVVTEGTRRIFMPGERFTMANPSELTGRAVISGDGKLEVNSLGRSYGVPEYRGSLEIIVRDGGFIIVNEVDIEEYLYSVLPSEMPVSFGIEALKVQAITARSYAYNQFYSNNFHRFGANVCDSVMSQVYNNMREAPESMQAVRDTRGMCLTFNGSVISANFFSTSAGVTANNGEVWAQRPLFNFPANTRPYLVSVRQYSDDDFGDLSVEANMVEFIRNRNVRSYDSWSNFFRWYVEMTNAEITATINANLRARYDAGPRLIKTLQPDGEFRARPIDTIGKLVNLEVVERGQAGNIMDMKITGTENTILVRTEFNIRSLLMPRQHVEGGAPIGVTLNDGAVRENLGLLPSAFFVMERMTDGEGNILYVRFHGGGNGHGVGMSQTGARGMIDAGRSFEEVLSHFYPGTVVERRW